MSHSLTHTRSLAHLPDWASSVFAAAVSIVSESSCSTSAEQSRTDRPVTTLQRVTSGRERTAKNDPPPSFAAGSIRSVLRRTCWSDGGLVDGVACAAWMNCSTGPKAGVQKARDHGSGGWGRWAPSATRTGTGTGTRTGTGTGELAARYVLRTVCSYEAQSCTVLSTVPVLRRIVQCSEVPARHPSLPRVDTRNTVFLSSPASAVQPEQNRTEQSRVNRLVVHPTPSTTTTTTAITSFLRPTYVDRRHSHTPSQSSRLPPRMTDNQQSHLNHLIQEHPHTPICRQSLHNPGNDSTPRSTHTRQPIAQKETMTPKLKPLLLPQLVEERRKRESSILDAEMDLSNSSFYSQSSSISDFPSPITPTFSGRGHMRYSSSASSIDSTFHSCVVDCPSSPTFVATKTGKRSLPDVKEEPQEREGDFDMLDEDELYDCLCDNHECLHRAASTAQSFEQLSTQQTMNYDLVEGFMSEGDSILSPRKRQRANEFSLTGLAGRFGTRLPSFSRKWRLRKDTSSASAIVETQRDRAVSRAASSRSSSISNPPRQVMDMSSEPQMPPTPARSIFGSREDVSPAIPIDIEKANDDILEREEKFATTPLLPPLMTDALTKEVAMQSPLQSPSVAEPHDPLSGTITPVDGITTPQLPGIPSPALSTKPSISSFHRSTISRPGHLIPTSDSPSIIIADPNDEWANKLGHANFTIYPEPYTPESFDLEACRQLRSNWDLARCNYTKHLVRTGEHYGVTSKTYQLTEEKWQSVDGIWRKYNEITITNTVESGGDAFATLKHNPLGDASSNNIMTRIPSLNDPRSQGRFPELGDEDIVGPMVQAAAQIQRSPSKKTKLIKFFTEKFPAGLGRP
ncbi:uncharacterized protein BP5553_05215 [Venustampulla echinocandica]|uniref:Only prolin and serin are matching in the corresponding protein n=1 Tax=Venustampulla echinocandica TaxID=2656787 RepID=A0A370TQJ1_9HELO|nr:uncharacterized protein BP5553_05215 [Venustampulla echinocandica]RDL37782.1 hypothetical protein BP5553_05215 [Venustampulla echinocandica]